MCTIFPVIHQCSKLEKVRCSVQNVVSLWCFQPDYQVLSTLQQRVLYSLQERLVEEQQHNKQLQSQLHAAQASHDQAAAAAASQLAAAQQALSQLEQEATEKLGQADAAAVEAEGQLDDLAHELEEAKDAVKVVMSFMPQCCCIQHCELPSTMHATSYGGAVVKLQDLHYSTLTRRC